MEHTYFMPPEEDDLALSMSGNGLERVSDALHSTHASAHLTSLHRELGPADTLKACSSLSDTVDHSWCDKSSNSEPNPKPKPKPNPRLNPKPNSTPNPNPTPNQVRQELQCGRYELPGDPV